MDSKTKKLANQFLIAVKLGDIKKAAYLIQLGVRKSTVNNDLDTALIIAARAGYSKIVRILMRYCPDTAIQNKAGYTALMHAAENGHVQVVKLLLPRALHNTSLNIDNHINQKADAALILAVKQSHYSVVEALTAHRVEVDVDCADSDGHTPLMHAIVQNNLKMVNLLIENGAMTSLKMVNNRGETALILAIHQGNQAIISRLLMMMSDAEVKNLQKYPFYQSVIDTFESEMVSHRRQMLTEQAQSLPGLSGALANLTLSESSGLTPTIPEPIDKENMTPMVLFRPNQMEVVSLQAPLTEKSNVILYAFTKEACHNVHQKTEKKTWGSEVMTKQSRQRI